MVVATLYDWLLFLHVLAAMVWVGGVVTLAGLVTVVLRRGDRDDVVRFIGNLRRVAPFVLAPAPGALVVLGIWMVVDSDAWDFGQLWIWLALGLFAAAFLVGVAHQSRAAIGAERAAGAGDVDEAARLLNRWSWGTRLILVLLVVATWDMVLKPGL
jgi:uncharacterized membrane protein